MLKVKDVLISRKNHAEYTITQVRVSPQGKLLSYLAVDSRDRVIVVYRWEVDRWDYRTTENRKWYIQEYTADEQLYRLSGPYFNSYDEVMANAQARVGGFTASVDVVS